MKNKIDTNCTNYHEFIREINYTNSFIHEQFYPHRFVKIRV